MLLKLQLIGDPGEREGGAGPAASTLCLAGGRVNCPNKIGRRTSPQEY